MVSLQSAEEATVSGTHVATSETTVSLIQMLTRVRDSPSDFRPPKRQRIMSPVKPKPATAVSGDKVEEDEDEVIRIFQ